MKTLKCYGNINPFDIKNKISKRKCNTRIDFIASIFTKSEVILSFQGDLSKKEISDPLPSTQQTPPASEEQF